MRSESELENPRFPIDVSNVVPRDGGEDVNKVLEVFFESAKGVPEQTNLLPAGIVTDTLPDTRNCDSHNLNRDPNLSPENREHSQCYSDHSITKRGVEWTKVGMEFIEDLLCRCRWKIVMAEARTVKKRLFNITNQVNGNSESDILDEVLDTRGQ